MTSEAIPDALEIRVSLAEQRLVLLEGGRIVRAYPVSTSKHGAGELRGSHRTPRGRHVVRAKIGAGAPIGAVFRGRRPTGEIYSEALARAQPGRDWILTRILWLSGLEVGRNRLGEVDTMRRYIYIHGTPDSTELGVPGSIGCIRMANADIVELFDRVPVGTAVNIE
ncbi:MAG TPA: L,D-transpeptidase [Gammaproteobacteria bacterium]